MHFKEITLHLTHLRKWWLLHQAAQHPIIFNCLKIMFYNGLYKAGWLICFIIWNVGPMCYWTITSLRWAKRQQEEKKKEGEDPRSQQQGRVLYLDDKMTASAGTKSLPFTLIISPTWTCENKLVTAVGLPIKQHRKCKINIRSEE